MPRVCPTCGTTYDEKHVFCPADGSSLRALDDGGELIGSVLADRYLIIEKLGEGGMGRVYLAQHVRLPQRAAIKVLHPSLLHDPEALARFNREAANACQIDHQHVARVYDFGEGGAGLIYLAMEYVPGQTLSALLEAAGPLAPERAVALLRQIAAGLDAAHKLGIVHRDLKPDNILVMRDDDGTEQVKVVDFGIAKAIDSRTQVVTRTGLVVGTALYMSPEQVSGHVIDKRSDVYALGLVAFVMLTGTLPFEGDTAEEAMIRRLSEPPRTLAEANPDVAWPADVQAVMDHALARDLPQRHATAGAFARELATAVGAWRGAASASAVAPAPVAPAPVAPAPSTVDASAVAPAPAAPERSGKADGRRRTVLVGGVATALAAAALVIVLAMSGDGPQSPAVDGGERDLDSASGVVAPPDAAAPDTTPPREAVVPSNPVATKGEPAKSEVRPQVPPPPDDGASSLETRVAIEREALARLDRIAAALHPDVITAQAARDAVLELPALLPTLPSARDSVRADLGRANAHFYLDQIPEACRVLRSLRARASGEARMQVDVQIETLGCN